MSFPDFDSLKFAAKVHNFRDCKADESEDEYRAALANHVNEIDFIEGEEIRNKVGWDQFTPEQNFDMLKRRGMISGEFK